MNLTTYTKKIIAKDPLTNDVVCFKITKPENFQYKSGQFIRFHIPDKENKTGEVFRSYSISSTPNDEFITFCIRLVPGGKAGEYLKNLTEQDEIKFSGPMGRFVNDNQNEPLNFIATGVGIAPIIGIIRDELENKKNTHPINLLFGLRNEVDLFWTELFQNLSQKYPNFTYQITLSQPSEQWTGPKGRVTEYIPEIAKKGGEYFICGNIQMINDVKNDLVSRQIPIEKVHFEAL